MARNRQAVSQRLKNNLLIPVVPKLQALIGFVSRPFLDH